MLFDAPKSTSFVVRSNNASTSSVSDRGDAELHPFCICSTELIVTFTCCSVDKDDSDDEGTPFATISSFGIAVESARGRALLLLLLLLLQQGARVTKDRRAVLVRILALTFCILFYASTAQIEKFRRHLMMMMK